MTDVIDPVEALRKVRAKMLAAMLAARTGDGQELLRSDMKLCAPAASAGILLDAALTAAEAAGMVWVQRDTLQRARDYTAIFERSSYDNSALDVVIAIDAVLAARPSLTVPEQATREGDATP